MQRAQFIKIVLETISELPEEFRKLMENIDIVVEDWPSRGQLRQVGLANRGDLFGLYEGTPLTERDQHYNLVLPDKITIFQKPIEAQCPDADKLKLQIERTVKHEIAHFFGLDEATMDKIEHGYDT